MRVLPTLRQGEPQGHGAALGLKIGDPTPFEGIRELVVWAHGAVSVRSHSPGSNPLRVPLTPACTRAVWCSRSSASRAANIFRSWCSPRLGLQQPVHDAIAGMSRQGLGPAEIARRLGEPRIVVTQIRARMDLSARRGTTKPGDPERAERLSRAPREFWQQSNMEWPEIARRCGTTQSTVGCWYDGKRKPCEASLDRIERFLNQG